MISWLYYLYFFWRALVLCFYPCLHFFDKHTGLISSLIIADHSFFAEQTVHFHARSSGDEHTIHYYHLFFGLKHTILVTARSFGVEQTFYLQREFLILLWSHQCSACGHIALVCLQDELTYSLLFLVRPNINRWCGLISKRSLELIFVSQFH